MASSKDNWKFRWRWSNVDIVFPWLTCLTFSALSIVGAIKVDVLPAKILCSVLASILLAVIPLWYFWRAVRAPNYITSQGVEVFFDGTINCPVKEEVELFLGFAESRWEENILDVPKPANTRWSLKGKKMYFRDEEVVYTSDGRPCYGYSSAAGFMVIGFKPVKNHVDGLVIHEVSHQIAWQVSYMTTEEEHHEFFAKIGV